MRPDLLKRYHRDKLSAEHQDFFEKLIPFAQLIQKFTRERCAQQRIDSNGIYSSLIAGYLIEASNWGEHELASKYNNLAQFRVYEYWHGKTATYSGKEYRVYPSWLDFSIDFADEFTNTFDIDKYLPMLTAKSLDDQLDLFTFSNNCSTISNGTIEEIIEHFGIWEFDA